MDNNYFESLANSIQDSEPKTNNTQENSEATLTVKVDINCKLYCDGEFLDLFEANKVKKISIPTGQHLITIESEQFDEITEDQVIDAMEPGKNYLLLVKDLKEKEDIFKKNKESKIAQATAENEEKEKEKDKEKKQKEQEELKKAQLVQEVQDNLQKGKEYYEAHIYDLAISCFEKVVSATNDAEALLYIGLCYEGQDGDDGSLRDAAKALPWYRKSADQGFAKAQKILGDRYREGKGVEQNYVEAVKWYRKAAAQGLPGAQNNLGICYDCGIGVDKDLAKAAEWYTKAAEQGEARAQCNLGLCYESGDGVGKDLSKAVEWYTKAAEQGNARAQHNLGYCYECGNGVGIDFDKAVGWYAKAAEQGYASAQYNLGRCYEQGIGVGTDWAKAAEWYTKAAEQGNARAQNFIGYCFWYGLGGVEQDLNKAVEWLTKAAEQGYAKAWENLENFCWDCWEGDIKYYDPTKVLDWFLEAAGQGNGEALDFVLHYLGDGFEVRERVEKIKNKKTVFEVLAKAADNGNVKAQYRLGMWYVDGVFVKQDKREGFKRVINAGEQGSEEAKELLINLIQERWIKGSDNAIECLTEAAEQGSSWAQMLLNKK